METQSQPGGFQQWIHTNAPIAWIVALLAAITLLFKLRRWRLSHRVPVKNMTPDLIFEIPDTVKSRAFATHNPHFLDALPKLFETANKCLARDPRPKDHLENTCFWLGHTCRQDFTEIVFLGVSGYGAGATKILRSLYERAVTIAYLIKHPEKVERFNHFASIQEHRAMEAALRLVSEQQFDAAMNPQNTVAKIRERYEQCRGTFKTTKCEVCGVKPPLFWDVDFVTMIHRVGEPYERILLLANTNPNFQIHATLASASPPDEDREEKDSKTAIMVATDLFLAVIRSQNDLFSLGLDADIEACAKDILGAIAREF